MDYSVYKKDWPKFVIGWVVCFLIRLFPFRPPNIEPILTTQMPFAKRYGWFGGFVFGFLSILIFDAVTSGVGMWTWITGAAYGLLGVGAYFFFRKREGKISNFLIFGIVGTILYDAVTGLSIGPLFFGQTFMEAFVGQIPFTLNHLLGNVVFSVVVSPLIYRWVVTNENLGTADIRQRLFGVRI
jgi:energy-coupling factor transport system substrate-specific component